MIYFYATRDSSFDGCSDWSYEDVGDLNGDPTPCENMVIFGNHTEISNGVICGDGIPSDMNEIRKILQDSGYLINNTRYYLISTNKPLNEIKNILNSMGFVENKKLADCKFK